MTPLSLSHKVHPLYCWSINHIYCHIVSHSPQLPNASDMGTLCLWPKNARKCPPNSMLGQSISMSHRMARGSLGSMLLLLLGSTPLQLIGRYLWHVNRNVTNLLLCRYLQRMLQSYIMEMEKSKKLAHRIRHQMNPWLWNVPILQPLALWLWMLPYLIGDLWRSLMKLILLLRLLGKLRQ